MSKALPPMSAMPDDPRDLLPEQYRAPRAPVPPSSEQIERMLSALHLEAEAAETSWRSAFTDLPSLTRQRAAIALQVVAAVLWMGLIGVRADLGANAMGLWFAGLALPLLALGAWATTASLESISRRPPTPLAAALVLAFPTMFALLPWPGMHMAEAGPASMHVKCAEMGIVLAAIAIAPVLLMQRTRPANGRLALLATGGGTVAFVVQNLYCPLADHDHLVFAHGVSAVVLAGALVVASRVLGGRRLVAV